MSFTIDNFKMFLFLILFCFAFCFVYIQKKQWKHTIHKLPEKTDQFDEQKRREKASLFWDKLIEDLDKE